MKRIVAIVAGAALACSLAACGSSVTPSSAPRNGTGGATSTSTTGSQGTSTVPGSAPAALSAALVEASDTEHSALATYEAIIGVLGSITPFASVASAEQQHVDAVNQVAGRYGVTLPTAAGSAPAPPATKTAACQLGVTTEQHVISVYDTLIPQVGAYPDVVNVFTTLRAAAEENHLPAFEHCA